MIQNGIANNALSVDSDENNSKLSKKRFLEHPPIKKPALKLQNYKVKFSRKAKN